MSERLIAQPDGAQLQELAEDLKSSFVPVTEIFSLAEQFPRDEFEYLWQECGWDGLVFTYPELAELAPGETDAA